MPSSLPVCAALIVLPLLSMAAVLHTQSRRETLLAGLCGAGLELLLAGYLLNALDHTTAQAQFVERLPLLPFLIWHTGVDGLNVLFIAATALLGFLLVLYGHIAWAKPPGHYMAALFAYQAVLMGLFTALDALQFWLLAGLEMLPAAYISLRWGRGLERRRATGLYVHFISSGLFLLGVGLAILGWHHADVAGDWSFDLAQLAATPPPETLQHLAFVFVFFGLAVRMAQFPFHAWLPELSQHGTMATTGVFLVGTKLGIYALLRFLPLVPEAAHTFKPLAAGLGLCGIFYGALLALMQLNLRRLLAFAAVSHTGMLVVGVFCLNREGLAGALLLAINFGVAASALLFASGLLLHRAGSALLPRLGELFDPMPLLGLTFLIAALSTMAMPGTPGFDAAHLLLEGAIETHEWGVAVTLAIGNVLAAAFLLRAFQQVFLAPRRETVIRPIKTRLSLPEALLTGTLCFVMIGVGFYSEPWLEMVGKSVGALAERFEVNKEYTRAAP